MTRELHASTAIHSFFAKGTLVPTRDGPKPIEAIEVGDCVLSFPHGSTPLDAPRDLSTAEYRQVSRIEHRQAPYLIEMSIMDLAAGFKEQLAATPSSLIYQSGIGWSEALSMAFGSKLENSVFGNLLVTKSRRIERQEYVYGISVEEFCTYYTGAAHAWVHC